MRLVAGLLARNEVHRYLPLVIDHLRGLADRIVVLDDASDDGTWEWLRDQADEQLSPFSVGPESTFYAGEDRIRQRLLALCVEPEMFEAPTHILIQDADELVSDRAHLRARLEANPTLPAWSMVVREAWKADAGALYSREDGGWRSHPIGGLFKAPSLGALGGIAWRYPRRDLAVGRVPPAARQRQHAVGVELWHLGYLDRAERAVRQARYLKHDGGRFHASRHIASIMDPDERVRLSAAPWPDAPAFRTLRERFAAALGQT